MRIIRISIVLLIALAIFLSSAMVMAAEVQESNETKTNIKINEGLILNKETFSSKKDIIMAYIPGISDLFLKKEEKSTNEIPLEIEVEEEVKIPERSEREKKLDRFQAKRDAAKLPEGKFTINASAYTAAADECGKSDGITASGLKVQENETIACPPQFPFGVKIQIEGMGTYVCQDRGGAIKGNKFDIYMETKAEAFAFGRKNLLAEVVL